MPTRARAPVLEDATIPGALLPLPSRAPLAICVVSFTTSVVISGVPVGTGVAIATSLLVTSGSLRTVGVTTVFALVASLVFASELLAAVVAGLIVALRTVAVRVIFRFV